MAAYVVIHETMRSGACRTTRVTCVQHLAQHLDKARKARREAIARNRLGREVGAAWKEQRRWVSYYDADCLPMWPERHIDHLYATIRRLAKNATTET